MKRSGKRTREGDGRLRPSLDSLRVFHELADGIKNATRQGTSFASLSEAAESMSSSYSKSNVFRALDELRKVYGRQLVNRSTVTLTKEGETVHAWANALLELHARGKQWPIGDREQIQIGASSWILNFLVPEIVRAFFADLAKRKHRTPDLPDVDLVFAEYDVEQILVGLRKGAVHAGLAAVFATGPYPDLTIKTVRDRVATVMIASSHHVRWGKDTRRHQNEVDLADLVGETLCVIEADLYRVLIGLPEPRPGQNRILVENYATVSSLVRAGVAVGFLPQLHRGDESSHAAYQGLEVYRIKGQLPPRTLAILRRSGEELPEQVEAFLRIAQDELR
jgi:DNA-binding transcriptional LysR family regulator